MLTTLRLTGLRPNLDIALSYWTQKVTIKLWNSKADLTKDDCFSRFVIPWKGYNPDTVDLTHDHTAREYWLQCLQDSLPKFTDRAIKSQEQSHNVHKRAEKFKEQFLTRLNQFQHNPIAYGNLTVRSLLDLREHCLSEFDFHDPYMRQKQWENEQAMALFPGIDP